MQDVSVTYALVHSSTDREGQIGGGGGAAAVEHLDEQAVMAGRQVADARAVGPAALTAS